MEVVENATGYKCAISPATNDLNVVQIPKIYIAVQCILNIFIPVTAFIQTMSLQTRPIFTGTYRNSDRLPVNSSHGQLVTA